MTSTDIEVKPGLFHLDLNIDLTNDTETLHDVKRAFERNRNKDPTPHVYNVLDCILAFIDKKLPRSKRQSIARLEAILKTDQRHLNALAELEILYRQLLRTTDANECRAKIKTILSSEDKTDVREKAICLLEQGYSILFEEVELYRTGIASNKSHEVSHLLELECKKSHGERKDRFMEALVSSKKVSLKLEQLKELPKEYNESVHTIETAIKYLMKGFELLKLSDAKDTEIAVWLYYIAMAHNRLEKWLPSKDHFSIQYFWEALTMLKRNELDMDELQRFYIGRGYAYIGYICMNRHIQMKANEESFPFKEDEEYKKIISDPEIAFRKALSIAKDNINVLNRYSMYLMNKSKQSAGIISILKQAEEYLNRSIELSPESNWLAYSTRISLFLFWSRHLEISRTQNKNEIKSLLKKVVADGRKCFKTKITGHNCNEVVQACLRLAKFPNKQNYYGPEYVTNRDYLYEALVLLNQALALQGPMDYFTLYTLGTCLYELGEYREAVEWMKRAMYLADKSRIIWSFKNVCLYICALYNHYATQSNRDDYRYLMEELLFVFQFAVKISKSNELVEKVYMSLFQKFQFVDFVEFILGSNYRDIPKHLSIAKTITKLLQSDDKVRFLETIQTIEESSSNSSLEDMEPENLEREFKPSFTFLTHTEEMYMEPSVGEEYKYDFFVSHSSIDSGWVKSFLLRQLEFSFGEQRRLRGCFDERDFVPGKSIIDNIMYAITNSKRVILVLSPSFVKSKWCSYETNESLMHLINQRGEDKQDIFLIPIMIENCEVPEKLEHLTYGDWTDDTKVVEKLDRVKRLLGDF